MLPDRVSNPGPLTHKSGALPIALRGPAWGLGAHCILYTAYERRIQSILSFRSLFLP